MVLKYLLITLIALWINLAHGAATWDGPRLFDIRSQTVLPHLEEMRRVHVESQRCVAPQHTDELFPIMDQPAFHGCTLLPQDIGATQTRYQLSCASDNGAVGGAVIQTNGDTLRGHLDVKMGGKNMTLSQFIVAVSGAPCDP